MLDLYSRDCPRCGAHLEGQGIRCTACHRFLPRKLSKVRRIVENSAIGVAMVAIAAAFLAPDLVRALMGKKPPEAQAAVMRPWRGAGAEPAARAWAYSLEESLQAVCRSTFEQHGDRKLVTGALARWLPSATRDLGRQLTPDLLRLSAEEEKDALAIIEDDSRFMGECLRIAYEAIKPCEAFRRDLASPAAAACMSAPLTRALAPVAFRICSQGAKEPRVRRACTYASDEAIRLVEKQR